MTKLCFIDTETTSLRPDRRAWEIGIIARSADGCLDAERRWFVNSKDLDLGNADITSLKIGGFYDRHPDSGGIGGNTSTESSALREVERLTRGAHLVGAVPNFDADVLGARMRANDICPSWHYHLIDVEALAVGYLSKAAQLLIEREPGTAPELRRVITPPWKSDDLSLALGIKVSDDERHTALGDARFARAIYDAVTGRTP